MREHHSLPCEDQQHIGGGGAESYCERGPWQREKHVCRPDDLFYSRLDDLPSSLLPSCTNRTCASRCLSRQSPSILQPPATATADGATVRIPLYPQRDVPATVPEAEALTAKPLGLRRARMREPALHCGKQAYDMAATLVVL